jgi:hypothetical protein
MISLSLGNVLVAYAGGLIVLLLLVWLSGNFFRNRRESGKHKRLIHCMFCGTLYENSANDPLPHCPQCARPNERTPPPAV